MQERKLEVGPWCHFVETSYGEGVKKEVSLEYTEHATDHWSSDSLTYLSIDEGKAREIVAFLSKAFEMEVTP